MHNFLKIKYLNKKIKMGNCQKILDSQKEIIFESQLPKRTFNYQKLNKTIIFEYSYIKYHHPIPISINQPIEKPPKYYKNEKPPDIINEKFIDTYFPPSTHSLEYISEYNKNFVDLNEIKEFKNITWKRVADIFKDEKYDLFNTLDVDDVKQGIIGNCYFLCVLSSFAKRAEIYDKIFIDKKINKNGLYKLRFIINGIPQIIFVDDYFPTLYDKFAFAQSPNEFWVQLLEKAWAKLNISYANTISGIPYEVFNCLSEAPCQNISHEKNSIYFLWNELLRAKDQGYYITCNTKYLSKEQEDNEGLISGHSYAVIDLFEFNIFYKKGTISESSYKKNKKSENNNINKDNIDNNNVLRIMKIYNPWAYFEWKGKFNDNDEKNWNRIPLLKKLVGYNNNDDGIFFMEFKDYYKKFHSTYILNYLKDWIYNYKIINQKNSDYFTCVKVELKKENQIRFGLHVKQSRFNLMEKSIQLYPVLLIIVKYNKESNEYTLINTAFDITDNLFSSYYKAYDPGEYHILMHFNADGNKVSDFTYTLSTYSQESVELLDITDSKEIPSNYLSQIINEYMKINEKELDENNNDIIFYFDNNNNNLGLYYLYVENRSNFDYYIEFNIENNNCGFIQDEFVINYFYENSINSNQSNIGKFYNKLTKNKNFNQVINYFLKRGENKIFIWKLNSSPKNSTLNMINKKFVKYEEKNLNEINLTFLENLNKYEMIINIYDELEKTKLSEDLEYSEIENIEYIFLIIKNINKEKSFVLEIDFTKSVGLTLELIKKEENENSQKKLKTYSIILYSGKLQIISLKKEQISSKDRYDFIFDYSVLNI